MPDRTGGLPIHSHPVNHYSLAFTYDWLASENERRVYTGPGIIGWGETLMNPRKYQHEGIEWPPRWDRVF